jgi:hypothetical protein
MSVRGIRTCAASAARALATQSASKVFGLKSRLFALTWALEESIVSATFRNRPCRSGWRNCRGAAFETEAVPAMPTNPATVSANAGAP